MTRGNLLKASGLEPQYHHAIRDLRPSDQGRDSQRRFGGHWKPGIIFSNGDRPSVTLDKAKAIIPV